MNKPEASDQCVVAVYASMEKARTAVHILEQAGIAPDRVSLVARHIDPDSPAGNELALEDDTVRDAAIGATLGGLAGVLGDATLVVLTGLGGFVVAGPLLALTGAVVGALLGAMRGWGVHESHIRKYEELAKAGKVLVIVDGGVEQVSAAERLLQQTDNEQLHLHVRSDDVGEVDDRSHTPAKRSSGQS